MLTKSGLSNAVRGCQIRKSKLRRTLFLSGTSVSQCQGGTIGPASLTVKTAGTSKTATLKCRNACRAFLHTTEEMLLIYVETPEAAFSLRICSPSFYGIYIMTFSETVKKALKGCTMF